MTDLSRLRGSFAALITPMTQDGALDEGALRRFVAWQIEQGSHGLVPTGTTGESPTLTHEEDHRVVSLTVEMAAGRVPVLAGTGSNSTAEAISLAKHAERAGADAIMVVTPYYNKPSQEGLARHYLAVADATDLPLILYNVPSRSVVDLSTDTVARLAEHPNIVGIKDATANLARPLHTRAACGDDFILFSGEDHTALAYLASGGDGCISVTANVAPALCAAVQDAWRARRIDEAVALQQRLLPLHDAMFCEQSPGPAKYAASLLGHCTDTLRLPLAPISESARARVRDALAATGLLP